MTTSSGNERVQREEQDRLLGFLEGLAEHAVGRLADGRLSWDTWLAQAALHGRYGFTNTLVISAQRSSATDVRSYDAWQNAGRQVRRGETGIRIISKAGKPRTVFDIEQTDGEAIENEPCSPAEGLARLSGLAADLELYIDRGQDWTYLGRPDRRIPVAPELDDATAAALLTHQLAHAIQPGKHIDSITAESFGCRGVRRIEADSVAFLVLAELGMEVSGLSFPPTARWAGTDARTDSAAAVRTVGDRIVRTSNRLRGRLHSLAEAARTVEPALAVSERTNGPPAVSTSSVQQAPNDSAARLRAALAEAHRFYRRNLAGSWGARYLANRGFTPALQSEWEIGLAPKGSDGLLRHLRALGYLDQVLIEAGLVKQRDGGHLFDLFRDRVLFPLRDQTGGVVGFIGRRSDEGKGPKYLNTPETTLFAKSRVLFGLYERRAQLAGKARPILVEGPLDAVAVNATMPETYAAVAPCGIAVTTAHIEAIADCADVSSAGLVIALDGDRAGQAGAVRAWRTVRNITGPVDAVVLPEGRDPAELLAPTAQSTVHEALLSVTPLADLVIDERINRFGGALEFAETQLAAAQAAAKLIAELPPDQIARQVARVATATSVDPAEVTALVAAAISPEPAPDTSLPPPSGHEQRDAAARASSRPATHPRTHRRTA